MLPDKKSKMRRDIEIGGIVGQTIVDHRISKPVKSYQKKVSSANWIVLYQCQNTETQNNIKRVHISVQKVHFWDKKSIIN